MDNPILTIIVPVYNHERYIEKALQSIQKQDIEYTYEVIIGEDCSTDHSREILQEYQLMASDNYFFIYRDHNWGMLENISDLFYRARGKYIIVLEGDDYWIYYNKINEQIRFLESNKDFSGCAHSVVMVDADGRDSELRYMQEKGKGIYDVKDYLHSLLPGQTASFMYRNYFSERKLFHYLGNNSLYPLDRFIAFVVVSKGKVYCTNEKWSAYRYVADNGSSFSANVDSTSAEYAQSALLYHKSIYEYSLLENCKKDIVKASEKLYYKSFFRDVFMNDSRNLKRIVLELRKAKYPFRTLCWIGMQFLCMIYKNRGMKYE